MDLHKILKYIGLILGVIGLILLGRVIMTGNDVIKTDIDVQSSVVDPYLYVAYIVFAITVVLVLIYVIKGVFSGDIKKTLISIGLFAVIMVLGYVMSSGTDLDLQPFADKGEVISESTSKMVGAGLNAFYFLAIIAIGAMVFGGIKKATK